MITILSGPSVSSDDSPAIVSRWLATESPNNFQLWRRDFVIASCNSDGASPECLELVVPVDFIGNVGDSISVYDAFSNTMKVGMITALTSPALTISTDIEWEATLNATWFNDNTLYAGYYFEGRLKVNDVVQPLTIIASPDSFGKANLDVSGILRIMVTIGKVADYSSLVASETNKGGKFTFAYRGGWYGSDEIYTEETNTWYYAEAVRSVEQGSNLAEYVATESHDSPFLNSFEKPVFFSGLPFDLSFILPVRDTISPAADLCVVIKRYNSNNTLLSTSTTYVTVASLEGKVCSLNIDPASIEEDAAYMTVEITAP